MNDLQVSPVARFIPRVWLSAGGLLTAAYFAVNASLNRRRSTAWARAWARVEPDWSHRA